jgi:hypothetical protein
MTDPKLAPHAAFLLRIAPGAMILSHSLLLKPGVLTQPGDAAFFESLGLPGSGSPGLDHHVRPLMPFPSIIPNRGVHR